MTTRIGQVRLLALFAVVVGAFVAMATARPPTKPVNEDDWFVVKLGDQQCGYMHSVMREQKGEVRTQNYMSMQIARGAAKVKIAMEQEYRETLDGKPLAFTNTTTLADTPMVFRGEVKGDKLVLTTEQFETKRTVTHPWDPEVRFSYGQMLAQRERGLKPGTKFSVKSYDPSLKTDGAVSLEIEVKGREKIDVQGKEMDLHHLVTRMTLPTGGLGAALGGGAAKKPAGDDGEPAAAGMTIESDLWVDDNATPVVTTMDMGVAKVNVYRSTKEEALKVAEPPELFLNTFITVDKRIGPEAKEVVYRLTLPKDSSMKMPDLPTTDMQTVKRVNDREVLLTVRRIDWEKLRSLKEGAAPGEKQAAYLKASSTVDINDKKIKRLGRTAIKAAKTPAEKADALRKYVTDYISHKGMDVGFATATEVARTKRGDCSEHGVLLAALARVAGFPSRGVSGIVEVPSQYLGGENDNAFGYHMWAQVWIDGQWVDIDGALRQTDCDATHIALTVMPLGEEGMGEMVGSLLPLMGRLKIEVVSVK